MSKEAHDGVGRGVTRNDVLFWMSLISAVWFALMGTLWTYGAALVIAYPVGLVSLLLWLCIRREGRRRTKVIPIILAAGLALSLTILVLLLISN